MTTIRPLTLAELPLCHGMGEAFMTEKQVPGRFDLGSFVQYWSIFLTQQKAVIFGLWKDGQLVGGIGGLVAPDVNTGEAIAQEFFWYVAPEDRRGTWPLRLLKSFRTWGQEQGATRFRMIHLLEPGETPSTVKLGRVYTKLGLRPIEVAYDMPLT